MRIMLAAIFGLWVFSSAVAQAQQTYPLWCRGKFSYIVHPSGHLQISLNKAQRAAGNMGRNLVAGTCAWSDRPISPSEPSVLLLRYTPAGGTTFVVCSQSTNCTFMVGAFNDMAGRFRVADLRVWIWNR